MLHRVLNLQAHTHTPSSCHPAVASLSINIALQALFLLLSVVFFLLAGGVYNLHCHKVVCWERGLVGGGRWWMAPQDTLQSQAQGSRRH